MRKAILTPLALSVLMSSTAMADTDIRFTLGWTTQGSDAAMLLALKEGYFEEEGLNVTIDQGEGSGATVTRIMSGTYDAGFGDINAIIQNASTRPDSSPVMVYNMWSNSPFVIVSKKETGIETPADLEGKTLGGSQGTPTTRLLPVFTRMNDVDLDTISIDSMAPNLQEPMLIRGDVDGVTVFSITSYFNLLLNRQDPEADFNWLNYGDFGLDLYSNGVMVSQKLLTENPEAVEGLVRAINRAAVEIGVNPELGVDAIMAYDNLVNRDIESQRMHFAYQNLIISDENDELGMGDLDDERLARAIDIIAEGYELESKPDVSAIFTREFLPAREDRELVYEAP